MDSNLGRLFAQSTSRSLISVPRGDRTSHICCTKNMPKKKKTQSRLIVRKLLPYYAEDRSPNFGVDDTEYQILVH